MESSCGARLLDAVEDAFNRVTACSLILPPMLVKRPLDERALFCHGLRFYGLGTALFLNRPFHGSESHRRASKQADRHHNQIRGEEQVVAQKGAGLV
jgi:hypothetical protein